MTATAMAWAKRVLASLLRAYQLSGDFKRPAGIPGNLYYEFIQALRAELCVIERDQNVQDWMEAPDKLRKGMALR